MRGFAFVQAAGLPLYPQSRGQQASVTRSAGIEPKQRAPAKRACGVLETAGALQRRSRGSRISSVRSPPQDIRIESAPATEPKTRAPKSTSCGCVTRSSSAMASMPSPLTASTSKPCSVRKARSLPLTLFVVGRCRHDATRFHGLERIDHGRRHRRRRQSRDLPHPARQRGVERLALVEAERGTHQDDGLGSACCQLPGPAGPIRSTTES